MPSGSRLEEGSSSTKTSGPIAQALAQAMRCFSPPDRAKMFRSNRGPTPQTWAAEVSAAAISRWEAPRLSRPKSTSLVVSRLKNWDLGFWNTEPTVCASSHKGVAATSRPSTATVPANAPPCSCWSRPLTSLMAVVLPQPLSPVRSTSSPGSTVKEQSRRLGVSLPS